MKLNHRFFGFYLALLIAVFKATGVSAAEELWFPQPASQEGLKATAAHTLWASEEILQLVKLPEYSENQFFGTAAIPGGPYQVPQVETERLTSKIPQRDLKSLISCLLFPFHFFL